MNPQHLPNEAVLRAATHVLRPLVRLLVRLGITFPVVAERLRLLFVEAAVEGPDGERIKRTDSRISLLTGIHRKEIRRLREARGEAAVGRPAEPAVVTLSSQIIARWLGYAPDDGDVAPMAGRTLPRHAATGRSFDRLVRTVTTDLRPKAVLDEWVEQGIVTMEPGDRIRLNTIAFVPPPGGEAQLFYFGRNLHDHLAAASANVLASGAAPFPDLSVHYDRLGPGTAEKLEASARIAAARLIEDVNREALALTDEETKSPPAGRKRRVNLGVYLYIEDDADEGPHL